MFSDRIDCRRALGISTAWRVSSAAAAATLVISLFYVGSQPIAVGFVAEPWDTLAHLAMFAAIAALLWISAAGRWPLAVAGTVTLIGALDEWHQAYLPGRQADVSDLLADAVAASMTILLLRARYK